MKKCNVLRTALLWVTASSGNFFHLPGSRILTPEDGKERLSRNVGNKLPLLAA